MNAAGPFAVFFFFLGLAFLMFGGSAPLLAQVPPSRPPPPPQETSQTSMSPFRCVREIRDSSEDATSALPTTPNLPGCEIMPLFYNQTHRTRNARMSGGLRKYISFSVYGSTPKYTVGAIKNARLASEAYPGWNTRFYVDASVPLSVVASLASLGAEVYFVNATTSWCSGMYWRFFIWDDLANVDVFQVRDTDSRLASRDRRAVDEWLADGTAVHVMRDHPSHSDSQISGGLWGARTGGGGGGTRWNWGVTEAIQRFASHKGRFKYRQDMDFLDSLWGVLRRNATQHDSFSCVRYGGKGFPTRPTSERFVGERLDENDRPHEGDLALYRRARMPSECVRDP